MTDDYSKTRFGNTTGQKAESLSKDISPLVRNEITKV